MNSSELQKLTKISVSLYFMYQEPFSPHSILSGNLFSQFFRAGILILQKEPCDVKEQRNYLDLPQLIKVLYKFVLHEPLLP